MNEVRQSTASESMIRLVIAEDQGLLLGALATLLELEPDLQVLARASDGPAALAALQQHRPEVLLTDIEMPGCSGLDVAEAVRREGLPTRVLIVTTFARPGYLRRAMEAGVRGYLLKDTPSAELAAAVRRVAAGQKVIAPELLLQAFDVEDPLNDRERQVLRLAEAGRTAKEIGEALGLAPGTARNYLYEASQKLGAANRIEAARIARERGLL